MNTRLAKLVRELQFRSPLRRYFFPRYEYNFAPSQLGFLCECLEQTRSVPGSIAEIGCSRGSTTIFLNFHMDDRGIDKPYVALDTFSGFVGDDVRFEVENRGKQPSWFHGFQANKKKWFDGTMRSNGVTRVSSIEADVNLFDLTALGPLAFILLDVDLYRPMRKALPELYAVLSPGGIIVVDDCDGANMRWDGSDQAYKEFVHALGREPEIVHGKLGVVRKSIR